MSRKQKQHEPLRLKPITTDDLRHVETQDGVVIDILDVKLFGVIENHMLERLYTVSYHIKGADTNDMVILAALSEDDAVWGFIAGQCWKEPDDPNA